MFCVTERMAIPVRVCLRKVCSRTALASARPNVKEIAHRQVEPADLERLAAEDVVELIARRPPDHASEVHDNDVDRERCDAPIEMIRDL